MRIIDADELKKQAYRSGDWDKPLVVDVEAIDDAPTIDPWKYPSRGELPDKDVECLVHTKSGNNFIAMIDSSDNCWCTGEFFGEYLKNDYVACWQYIVPPKGEA